MRKNDLLPDKRDLNLVSIGEVAEWPKAHAWKACVAQVTEGSNPSLSAIRSRRRSRGFGVTQRKLHELGQAGNGAALSEVFWVP